MSRRKVFDSDEDDEEFELLAPEKPTRAHEESTDQEDSEEESNLVDEAESNSDPEEIDFTVSKQTTLTKVKDAVKQIEAERQHLKNKRRKQNELFKIQKKMKVEALQKERLPEDFLKELDSVHNKEADGDTHDPENDASSENTELVEERLQSSDLETSDEEDQDYIPLRSEHIQAVYVKSSLEKSKTSAEAAADFRKNALFGSRVHREPVKEKIAKQIKRKARFH